jgi:hypothetical protein
VTDTLLTAECKRMDGSWNRTAIQIDGTENINGNLKLTGATPSSYQRSCRDIGANGDVLFATCRRIDGSWTASEILLPGIANIDGVLRLQP